MSLPVFSHAACLAHDTVPGYADCPARLQAVTDFLHARHPDL